MKRAALPLALLLASTTAWSVYAASPKPRPKPKPAVAAPLQPTFNYPPRLANFPCTAAGPLTAGRNAGPNWLEDARSTVGDRFSIRGRDGVFLCRPGVRAMATPLATDRGGAGAGLAAAAYADAKGETSPRLFYMPQTEAVLQRMAVRLAGAWPHPNTPRVEVKVASNSQFNAHAHPDNVIVVNVGVFMPAKGMAETDLKDNDLYWILGHEYAHVGLRHATLGQAMAEQTNTLKNIASVYMEGAKINAAFNYGERRDLSGDLRDQIRDAKTAHAQLQFALMTFVYPAWGRVNEDQADVAGFDLASSLGYFPRFDIATKRFEASEKTIDDHLEEMKDRVDARVKPIMDSPAFAAALRNGDQSKAFSALADGVKRGLMKGLRELMAGWFSRDHRLARSRGQGLTDYRKVAYQDAGLLPTPKIYDDEMRTILASSEMTEAIQATLSIEAAEANLVGGDARAARVSIGPALNTRFKRESLTLFTAAKAAEGSGATGEAISLLETSRNAPTVLPDAYLMLARLYTKGGRASLARGIITEGRRKTKDYDFFLPEDVRIASRANDMKTATVLIQKCRDTGRELIAINCVEALLDANWDKLNEAQQAAIRDLASYGASGQKDTARTRNSDNFFSEAFRRIR